MQFELDLPRARQAPSLARRSLEDWLAPALDGEAVEDVKLIVSELVTNAGTARARPDRAAGAR
jgi:anti-sigma regulatory factor (Ser/Thr protein kinase)